MTRSARGVVILTGALVLAAGCSSSLPSSVGSAPVLSVVTGLWPLAQVATMIGGDKVAVDDVVPDGADPITFRPGPSAADSLRSAGLVLEIGGGFQPGIESAADGANSVAELGSQGAADDPYVWLDPTTMKKVVSAVVSAMSRADPQAAPLFRLNEQGVDAQLESLGIDYSSTFAACPGTTIVTPDAAFSAVAAAYGLHDTVVGPAPSAASISALVSRLPANSATAGITEPWVDSTGVTAVADAGHFKTHQVETLASAPDGMAPSAANYFAQMEQILGQISAALGCSAREQ